MVSAYIITHGVAQDVEDAAQAFAKQHREDLFSFVLSTATCQLLPVEEGTKEETKAEGADEEGAKANEEVAAHNESQNKGVCASCQADRCDACHSWVGCTALYCLPQHSMVERRAWVGVQWFRVLSG